MESTVFIIMISHSSKMDMYDNFLHFYFNRITKLWNKIPEIDLSQTAKTKLYKVMWANFINNFRTMYAQMSML